MARGLKNKKTVIVWGGIFVYFLNVVLKFIIEYILNSILGGNT